MIAKHEENPIMDVVPPGFLQKALSHPRMQEVIEQVDSYFLRHWPFEGKKAGRKFVNAGFSRVTCNYFPKALDDRIHFASELLTILFLVVGKFKIHAGPRARGRTNYVAMAPVYTFTASLCGN